MLPVEQARDDPPVLDEKLIDPAERDAKVDIFLVIFGLPQFGHFTSSIELRVRTNSSKFWQQSLQANSNIGIEYSF